MNEESVKKVNEIIDYYNQMEDNFESYSKLLQILKKIIIHVKENMNEYDLNELLFAIQEFSLTYAFNSEKKIKFKKDLDNLIKNINIDINDLI